MEKKIYDFSLLLSVPREWGERASTGRLFQTVGASNAVKIGTKLFYRLVNGRRKSRNHNDICTFMTSMSDIVTPVGLKYGPNYLENPM